MLPETRAVFLKDAAASFAALGPERAERARARVPAAALRAIRDARPLEWLPVSHALEILRAIDAVAGPEGVRCCSVATIEASFRAPLLRAFIEAAIGAVGVSPSLMVRTVSRAWPLHYRNAGDLVVVDDGPGALHVVHADIPEIIRDPCWLTSLAACIGRVAGLAAPGATAEPREDGRRVLYAVRWPDPTA